ncbi:MAG TPA: type IV secretion system DNA-binding domain-containing protein, partial [Steroidobacteraceae bacterium]|nr:type IV secretion system DNA-binding domain-containing protein [Steroidobacteraceae bacterium]
GTGKSTAIREILSAALTRGDRAVIADPDGGYLRRFFDAERGDTILNPFDERSVKWDLFAEIKTPYDVEQLARSLIPDHEGSDRSWRGYARTFLGAVTRQAHEAGVTDTAELYRLMMVADRTELRALVKGTPAQPFLEEHNSKMFDSIRSVTSAAIGPLEYIARQRGSAFSVRSWVADDRRGVLFMPYSAGQIAALRSTISAWMRLAIFEAMDPREPAAEEGAGTQRRLWFVVDELDALGQIDGLKDALARLRKFGGRCILGFQSIAQVSSTYGQGDAHTIIENCGNTLILRCSASEGGGTARFASQLVGEREVLRTSISRSRRATELIGTTSRSEHVNTEHALLASQIEQLPDLAGYLRYASEPAWHRVQLNARAAWEDLRRSAASADSAARAARTLGTPARSREGHGHE